MNQSLGNNDVEILDQELREEALKTFRNVLNIWKAIGFSREEILERTKKIREHFLGQYEDLQFTEEEILENIQKNLVSYKEKVKRLQNGLNIKLVKLNDTNNNADTVDFINQQTNQIKQDTLLEETKYYKKMLFELEKIKTERQKKLNDLKSRERNLCNLLNESKFSLSDSSTIDENDLENYEHHINNLSIEKHQRISILKQLSEDINKLIQDYQLKLEPTSSLNKLTSLIDIQNEDLSLKINKQEIQIDKRHLTNYRNSMGKLIIRRDEMIESIDTCRKEILNYWIKYDLKNPLVQDLVEAEKPIYNQEAYDMLSYEYSRCCEMKKSKLINLIQMKRKEIEILWNSCLFDDNQKYEFNKYFKSDKYDDEILEKHEKYLSDLKEYAYKYESLYEALKDWLNEWEIFKEFDLIHSDPNRFHQRGYSSLNEQRERDAHKAKLNKLKKQLLTECENYYKNEISQFTFNGLTIECYIEKLKSEFEVEKENNRKERQAKTLSASKLSVKNGGKNFLTPQHQNVRTSLFQKTLLSKNSPSVSLKPSMSSSKFSISSYNSTSSINCLNQNKTPNSTNLSNTNQRKFLKNDVINEKKKSSIFGLSTNVLTKNNNKRRSIKEMNEHYKKNKRRSKILNPSAFFNPEIVISDCTNDFICNENDSILNTANFLNTNCYCDSNFTNSTSNACVMTGFTSASSSTPFK